MSLNNVHPDYAMRLEEWELMRDAYEGEGAIKKRRERYLPATPGQVADGMKNATDPGFAAYENYIARAIFPDYVSDAVEVMLGMMHREPPSIELPQQMEALIEDATLYGEGLQHLLRRINEQQLVAGRLGLLADLPTNADPANPLPYIAVYQAEKIINWDDSEAVENQTTLNLVVLDETGFVREDFAWRMIPRYRVLKIGSFEEDETSGVYSYGVFEGTDYVEADMGQPTIRGVGLNEIPFVFVNAKDNLAKPDNSPLLGLARAALAIYRGEADYRFNLFMQSQDTLVIIGGEDGEDPNGDELRVGAGGLINLPMGGDAKYVGVTSNGLSEQRQALDSDHKRAQTKAGQLVQATKSQAESGDALRIRIAAQTATLTQIALAGAEALETILKKIAVWMGLNADGVSVEPNLDFGEEPLNGQSWMQLMAARAAGLPLSKQSIHDLLREKGITDMDFESEMELIAEEDAGPSGTGSGVATEDSIDESGTPGETSESDQQQEEETSPLPGD